MVAAWPVECPWKKTRGSCYDREGRGGECSIPRKNDLIGASNDGTQAKVFT